MNKREKPPFKARILRRVAEIFRGLQKDMYWRTYLKAGNNQREAWRLRDQGELPVTLGELENLAKFSNLYTKIDKRCKHFNLSVTPGGLLEHARRKYEAYPPNQLICKCAANCICYHADGSCLTDSVCATCLAHFSSFFVERNRYIALQSKSEESRQICSKCGVVFINKDSNG